MSQSDVFTDAEIMEVAIQRPADGGKYLKRAVMVRRALREEKENVDHYKLLLEGAEKQQASVVNFAESCCDHVFLNGKCVCCGAVQ